MPVQRINIDICSVPSYESVPMIFLNLYGVDMGTSGLVVQTQSREEIYADKLLAFAFRPNRIKHRDLWDIAWLHGQGIAPRLSLLPLKLQDRHKCADEFLKKFHERVQLLLNNPDLEQEFYQEMARFLSTSQVQQIMNQRQLWQSIKILLQDLERQVQQSFAG